MILVAGSIAANYRNGGIAWERLSWVLGLKRLGLDVVMLDQLDASRCVFPPGVGAGYEHCLNRSYFERIIAQFGLERSAVLVGDDGSVLYGPTYRELLEMAEGAVLINVAGNVRIDEIKRRARVRVLVDVDPGLTQLWLKSGRPAPRIAGHDLHFTIGENVETSVCSLPTSGLTWRHTRQPVILDEWPVSPGGRSGRFTTVAVWRGDGPHGRLDEIGQPHAQKADEFAKVIDLPRRTGREFEVALKIRDRDAEERKTFEAAGWRLIDADAEVFDPDAFRRYVQGSWAEFSVAKGAYVGTSSGWFSDRTTRYLASGKPVLVQDTGFRRTLPVGEGLLAFRTPDDAVAGVADITSNYDRHARAARRIAEEYFDSDKVLTRFIDEVEGAR